jgi:Tfp pilus assembly protein PilN
MPSINMIAARRAEKRRQEQNIRKLLYGISAEIGCIVLAVSVLGVRHVTMHNHVIDLSDQIQKLEPKVNQIEALQKETAVLEPKVKTLDGAKADTLFWYSNLSAITGSLPQQTWLTALAVTNAGGAPAGAPGSGAGADPTVNLSGVALNQTQVGEAMLRMNQTPGLDHIDLSYVQQQKTGSVDTVSFQMTVHLKPEAAATAQGGSSDVKKS